MQNIFIEDFRSTVDPQKIQVFRNGIRAISHAAEVLLSNLRLKTSTHSQLGLQLAGLLKDLRQQRMVALDLAIGQRDSSQFDAFIEALAELRSTVAYWLTTHAANPRLIEAYATDFEMKCFSTLGSGVMWMDSLQAGNMYSSTDSRAIPHQHLDAAALQDEQAHGEDITDLVQPMWDEYVSQPGALAA